MIDYKLMLVQVIDLSLCEKDPFCGGKFYNNGIKTTLVNLYKYLDTQCYNEEASIINKCNQCIQILSEAQGYGSIKWKAYFWLILFNHH